MIRFIVTKRQYTEGGNEVLVTFREEHGDMLIQRKYPKSIAVTFVVGDFVCFTKMGKRYIIHPNHKSPYKDDTVSGVILGKRKRSNSASLSGEVFVVEVYDKFNDITQMFEISQRAYEELRPYYEISGYINPVKRNTKIEHDEMFNLKVYPYLTVTTYMHED